LFLLCVLMLVPAAACGQSGDFASPTPNGGQPTQSPSIDPDRVSPSPTPPDADPSRLDELRVAAEVSRAGYSRERFKHWSDLDDDGCDTRREVLIAESRVAVSVGPSCTLVGGLWFSPYDDRTLAVPSDIDIDHFVPLAEAWDSGAKSWTASKREQYANDLEHPEALIAVSDTSNQSKSDRDPAEWLPPAEDYRCTYAATWVEVKLIWELSVDEAELGALRDVLEACV
jgi:hypothetical protein